MKSERWQQHAGSFKYSGFYIGVPCFPKSPICLLFLQRLASRVSIRTPTWSLPVLASNVICSLVHCITQAFGTTLVEGRLANVEEKCGGEEKKVGQVRSWFLLVVLRGLEVCFHPLGKSRLHHPRFVLGLREFRV